MWKLNVASIYEATTFSLATIFILPSPIPQLTKRLQVIILAKMAQSIIVEALIASPSIQAAVVLVFISFAIRWYISLPPSPKFPKAELDDSDWHGSFLRAKIKVTLCYRCNLITLDLNRRIITLTWCM